MSPPSCCSIITLAASRETRKEPLAITLCCRSQSLTVVSSSGLDSDRPALLTTRSTPPNASAAAANISATAFSSDTSASHRDRDVRAAEFVGHALGVLEVEVGDDDAAALGGDAGGDGLADPGPGAGDHGDPGGQGLGLRACVAAWPLPAPSTRWRTSPPR